MKTELTLTMGGIAYDDPYGDIQPVVVAIHEAVRLNNKTFEKEVLAFADAAEAAGFDVQFDPALALHLAFFGPIGQ